MKKNNEAVERLRVTTGRFETSAKDGNNGVFCLKSVKGLGMTLIVSDGGGWDHVSVEIRSPNIHVIQRLPTWDEMCFVKNLFWDEEETVLQFHPDVSRYVNVHPYVLHLWKRQGVEYELPPYQFV